MPELTEVLLEDARPHVEAAAAPATPVLSLRDVSAHAPNGKTLLSDVTFSVQPGWMVAVVGPTGAGKTSLARVLTGALAVDAGSMRVNGAVAFVPQDDALHAHLSLRQALEYAAALRLPGESTAARAARVDSVIEELGLASHEATAVGDLSGGQRKRASIGTQLLGNPDVLVLDEPTAGLDPGYEKVVLSTLRAIADSGRTVVTVTHSVEALKSCDRVLFLGAGGSVAFYGPPKQAMRYFKMHDVGDVFLALDSAPSLWQQKFNGHPMRRRYIDEAAHLDHEAPIAAVARTACRVVRQARMLFRRHTDVLRGDRRHLLLVALQAPVVGALLWAVLPTNELKPSVAGEFGSRAGIVLLIVVLSSTWLAVSNAVRDVVRERTIVKWEATSGLSPRAYVVSKFVWLGGIAVVQSIIVTLVATARQAPPERVELVLIAGLGGLAASTLGLALSAMATSPDRAGALLPVTLVVQLALASEAAAKAPVPFMQPARSLIGTRWTMEAMAGSLLGNSSQTRRALEMLAGLTLVALGFAFFFVARTVRPARVAGTTASRPRVAILAAVGGLTLSLLAGGIGASALAHDGEPAKTTSHLAASATSVPRAVPTTVLSAQPSTTEVPATTVPAPRAPKVSSSHRSSSAGTETTAPAAAAEDVTGITSTAAPSVPSRIKPDAGSYPATFTGSASVNGRAQSFPSSGAIVLEESGSYIRQSSPGTPGEVVLTQVYNAARAGLVTFQMKAGSDTKVFSPSAPVIFLKYNAPEGTTWNWSATSTDGATTIDATGRVGETVTMNVGGEDVEVRRITTTLTLGGDLSGTAELTLWVSPTYRLPVVMRQVINANSQSGYGFNTRLSSDETTTLSSLHPN